MDASENDLDVYLQKTSGQLLTDFERSLQSFLWKTTTAGKTRVRRRVRVREADRLIALVNPFQELPQLLDPYLEKFIPTLGEALLQTLGSNNVHSHDGSSDSLLISLSEAVCRLIYTFCKVRGEKVIVRFLSPETKNLELLLSAIENAEHAPNSDEERKTRSWSWEERYVVILWLSHLLLAPFDLASISSAATEILEPPQIEGLEWPKSVPSVSIRVITLAMRFLPQAGKERDSAKALLVRLTMRRDMQEIGLLDALVSWALASLRPALVEASDSTYKFIGILSYLAGVLTASLTTSDLDAYLLRIFRTAEAISDADNEVFKTIHTSATARKTIIKVFRTLSILALQPRAPPAQLLDMTITEIVESTIGKLLEALADNDTPVRLAASKALSVITLKLQPDMAREVVEAVLAALNFNVRLTKSASGTSVRDLSAVNPLEWHGLVLTLSHLLYRRSPPPDTLAEILHALLVGLSFEQRSTSGTSVGTNVRDAACFGIWALARRYSTDELAAVPTSSVGAASHHDMTKSIIQVLATELMITASLDPAGNIRRGSSAALQELIGRHPDTVIEGIPLVQIVDYHAVALRSRAVCEVASQAARLSSLYFDGVLGGLLSWRGIGAPDPASRRIAAMGLGKLLSSLSEHEMLWQQLEGLIDKLNSLLSSLTNRDIGERHGLLLCLGAAFHFVSTTSSDCRKTLYSKMIGVSMSVLESAKTSSRRPELIAEGTSHVLRASFEIISCTDSSHDDSKTLILKSSTFLANSLSRPEPEVQAAVADSILVLMKVLDKDAQTEIISQLAQGALGVSTLRKSHSLGFVSALGCVFALSKHTEQHKIKSTLRQAWASAPDLETKCAIIQALRSPGLISEEIGEFVGILSAGLSDYTSDARGDVGSLVRVEALKTVREALTVGAKSNTKTDISFDDAVNHLLPNLESFDAIYAQVLRLSAEKLDRVRNAAQQTLAAFCQNIDQRDRFLGFNTSSVEYFRWLMDLQVHKWLSQTQIEYSPPRWTGHLLEGLVTSIDTGSEEVTRASRAALAQFCTGRDAGNYQQDFGEYSNAVDFVCSTILEVMKGNLGNDRLLVPTMETIGFLFDMGIMQQSQTSWQKFFVLVQKAHFKSTNMRKLSAAIKLYGGLVGMKISNPVSGTQETLGLLHEPALTKLTAMLLHPLPKIRAQAADMLFVARGLGKGVDWTKASGKEGKDLLGKIRAELGITA